MAEPPFRSMSALLCGTSRRDDPDHSAGDDQGSAAAEFAMVAVILLLLFLSLLQVCLWAYSRNLLTAAATEAARYAGLAGVSGFDGRDRVLTSLGDGLGTTTRTTLACTVSGGAMIAEVRCTMDAPGLVRLLDGVMPQVDVTGHAARELLTAEAR